MINISHTLYQTVMLTLTNEIDGNAYFTGTINGSVDQISWQMNCSVFVYYSTVSIPEGECRVISDLVPVWWEFHTVTASGECVNDFCFRELQSYLG